MLKIKCPKCGTALNVPDDQVQGKGRCTSCGVKFLIPANEEDEIEIIEENKFKNYTVHVEKNRKNISSDLLELNK